MVAEIQQITPVVDEFRSHPIRLSFLSGLR
jgi:hypothetical protein